MLTQGSILWEASITHIALVRHMTRVQPHMRVKGAILRESLVAYSTRVWLFPCVCSHMLVQSAA